MAGVRIQHVTDRNCRWTLIERDRPYPTPYVCTPPEFGGCGTVHESKAHHLNLDETGSVIVGDVLYERLRPLLLTCGFAVVNEVRKPPTLGIGLAPQRAGRGAWGNIPILGNQGD